MDFLENEETISVYENCKYIVKHWEHEFKKTHKRVPSKLDIREANPKVKKAYKTYFYMKTAALEKSLTNLDGFDNINILNENSTNNLSEAEHLLKNLNTDKTSKSIKENLLFVTENVSEKSPTKSEPVSSNSLSKTEINHNNSSNKTWGSHLNKNHNKDSIKSEPLKVNKNLSNKLFEGSKSSKRLPRKSLSFVKKKKDLNVNKFNSLSQPTTLTEDDSALSDLSCIESDNRNAFSIFNGRICSQPTNLIQNVVNNGFNFEPIRNLDSGWVGRISKNACLEEDANNFRLETTLSMNTKMYDSDEIIENSEDELENSYSMFQVKKKYRCENGLNKENYEIEKNDLNSCDSKRLDFSNIFKKDSNSLNVSQNDLIIENKNIATKVTVDNKQLDDLNLSQNKNIVGDKIVENMQLKKTRSYTSTTKQYSTRNTKFTKNYYEKDDDDDKDPFCSASDDDDPDFSLNGNKNKFVDVLLLNDSSFEQKTAKESKRKIHNKNINEQQISSIKNKKTKKYKKEKLPQEILPDKEYELEYSIKPRTVSKPRIENIKEVIILSQENVSDDVLKNSIDEQKRLTNRLEKKAASRTLNDNFVRINMKKKIFVRGKKGFNFSKYKKQQWNKKKSLCGPNMDMGGCDGGELVCFECGKTGHFARNCKSIQSNLLPREEDTLHFPTLEEAAKQAMDSGLVIKKPNIARYPQDESSEENLATDNVLDNFSEMLNDDNDEELLVELEHLEDNIAKIDIQKYVDTTKFIQPYYHLNDDGSLIDTPTEVYSALTKFGFNNFRSGQEKAIMRVLSGKSTLVTLSTGSGKSLCYQLPAYIYSKREPCISLVISPLVSLMEDQILGIPKFLNAACLHTYQTKTQKQKIMERINSGNIHILLVSPEAVVAGEKSAGFGSLLRQLPPIAFACIDEAHCVSQWSHNFRPSYLKICQVLRERLGVNIILGLTATATRATSDSIIKHFNILDGRNGIIDNIPLPDNLTLTVSYDNQKDIALVKLLLSAKYVKCNSIIVYCTRREECQRVAAFLRTSLKNHSSTSNMETKKRKRFSMVAEPYHAGMSASSRKNVQNAFMNGELRIVVATVAFGMGINKSDLRAVIHYNMPMSFESYVQEVGRAGRDGLPAYCHLFLEPKGRDENELLRHIYANSTDRHVIRKLLQRCFVSCSCKGICPKHEVAFSIEDTVRALDIPEENIETLLCYLQLHEKKYIEILSHVYVTCKIVSYGSANEIIKAAKECPPLAIALIMHQKKENLQNSFEFPVVEVASAIGWDSGICKHKLKNLEWITENNQPRRSKLSVQFYNLGFHLVAPGNLKNEELDEALDNLYKKVQDQEQTSILQLTAIHSTLTAVAFPSYDKCLLQNDNSKEEQLKIKIREYFVNPNPLEFIANQEKKIINEEQIINDIRSLIFMYQENAFTGRAIARIFYGIQSPNYPAVIWGRCKFWRTHLGTDFNTICQIATREILKFR